MVEGTPPSPSATALNTVEKIKNACEKYLINEGNSASIKKSFEWENAICEARMEIMQYKENTGTLQYNLFFQGWIFGNGRDKKTCYPLIGIFDINNSSGITDVITVLDDSIGTDGKLNISKNGGKFVPQSYVDGTIGDTNSARITLSNNLKTNSTDFFAVCVVLDEDVPRILLVYVVILPENQKLEVSVGNTFADLTSKNILTDAQKQKAESVFLEFFNSGKVSSTQGASSTSMIVAVAGPGAVPKKLKTVANQTLNKKKVTNAMSASASQPQPPSLYPIIVRFENGTVNVNINVDESTCNNASFLPTDKSAIKENTPYLVFGNFDHTKGFITDIDFSQDKSGKCDNNLHDVITNSSTPAVIVAVTGNP